MKKIFYEKVGRRYVPVAEYNSDWMDSYPKGTHLVVCQPGIKSRRFNVDPAYAPLIAAGQVAEDAISNALMKASELRLQRKDRERKLTLEEKAAWDNLVRVFGDSARQLEWPSIREAAEAGVKAMIEESDKLLQNESVRKAYDHFILMCKLTKEQNSND